MARVCARDWCHLHGGANGIGAEMRAGVPGTGRPPDSLPPGQRSRAAFRRPVEGCTRVRPRACGEPSRHRARITGDLGLAAQTDRPGVDSAGQPHRVGNGKRSILRPSDQLSNRPGHRRARAPTPEPASSASQVAGERPSGERRSEAARWCRCAGRSRAAPDKCCI